jgi:maltoporin
MLGSLLTSTASGSAAAAAAVTDDAASVDNQSQDAICLRTRSKHPLAAQVNNMVVWCCSASVSGSKTVFKHRNSAALTGIRHLCTLRK